MVRVTINGSAHEFPAGLTILDALQRLGIKVPTLCHDERLIPCGACRLCEVEIAGWCDMRQRAPRRWQAGWRSKRTPPESRRPGARCWDFSRTVIRHSQPRIFPKKNFTVISGYCVTPPRNQSAPVRKTKPDASHPYIHVDMAQCITCFRCVRICDEVQGQFVWHVLDRGDDTRIVPDGTTLLASSCVSCGACVDTCPTGALEDQSVLDRQARPTKWTRTTCPYCGVGCEMNVGTRDGRIVQVKPALDAPVSKGHLCVKGRYAFDFTHAADRVTEPMIRRGWRMAEGLVARSHRLRGRKASAASSKKHGPDSIGVLGSARGTNEENYLAQKFARVVLGTNNVDCCARVCHAPTAAA